jgi:phosphoribosyl-AMP cyclohydrolase / phosphoribosyl-ATP pyrophosphohydrolase
MSVDRGIRTRGDVDRLEFNDRGLIPVVAQDVDTGAVLMMAWADRAALDHTLETGFMHYHSRSRDELWKKGATSGNVQEMVSLHGDCDGDTVLARVRQTGEACHTGTATCFGDEAGTGAEGPGGDVLARLQATLEARLRDRPEGSYTSKLLADENLRVKKLGEESAELIAALTRGDPGVAEEAADLVYHLMVALLAAGRSWAEVVDALRRRQEK